MYLCLSCRILIFVLWSTLLIGQQTYYVSPTGNDANDGLAATAGPTSGPFLTLAMANQSLASGDTLLIAAGTYTEQIRPSADGTSNDSRIVYRPLGDGKVILRGCFNSGGNELGGAIALGRKQYITVSGRPSGSPVETRMLEIQGEGPCGMYGNMAGSTGCVVENVRMIHNGDTYAPNRGFVFADYWWEGVYETKFCVLRNCEIQGYIRDVQDPQRYTEDIIVVAQNAHHILIESNTIGPCRHVSVNFNQATTSTCVVRDNTIHNPEHTALSFYGLGENPTLQHHHLVEGNDLRATMKSPAPAGNFGNSLQFGACETIIRYNVIAEGGGVGAASSIGGISASMGGFPGQILDMSDNRFYNNTIVNNGGPAVGSYFFGGDGVDKGRNVWVNNIIYGSDDMLIQYWPGFDDGSDRFVANLFGNPGAAAAEEIIDVGLGPVSLASATTTYTYPNQPQFSAWYGFANIYEPLPSFANYAQGDYRLLITSPTVDAGAPLTRLSSTDDESSIELRVEDARMFYGVAVEFPDWMGVHPDRIAVGPSIDQAEFVNVLSADREAGILVIDQPIRRSHGDFVWLWSDSSNDLVVLGSAPDIGASEHAGSQTPIPEIILFDDAIEFHPEQVGTALALRCESGQYQVEIRRSDGSLYEIIDVKASERILLENLPAGSLYLSLRNLEQLSISTYTRIRP